jgi:hypothetical protein
VDESSFLEDPRDPHGPRGDKPGGEEVSEARATIARLSNSLERAEYSESNLRDRLLKANERIEFLESEVTVPSHVPAVPSWISGRLRRSVLRAQAVFKEIAELEGTLEEYDDALSLATIAVDELYMIGESASVYELRTGIGLLEDALRYLLESSVPPDRIQKLVTLVSEAEDEICLAISEDENAPLRLGPDSRRIRI